MEFTNFCYLTNLCHLYFYSVPLTVFSYFIYFNLLCEDMARLKNSKLQCFYPDIHK